jgi:anti-sigma regulatory factor (Ser/Thr protein kinase)
LTGTINGSSQTGVSGQGRRRAREPFSRARRVEFTLTGEEYAVVMAAARQTGLARGGCAAQAALAAAANGNHIGDQEALGQVLIELMRDSIELLVSELVTNAVKATAGRDRLLPIRLHLSSDKERLLIEVWDGDPRPPVLTELGEDGIPALRDEGGRGLFLVAALSYRWNWYASRERGGKVVRCEVQLRAGHGSPGHGTNSLKEGTSPAMSSPASQGSAASLPGVDCESASVPVSAPGTALPLRPQPTGMDVKQWVSPDPEILRRVKAALTRL